MLEHQLRDQLANVANRIGKLWLWKRLTWCWIAGTALLVTWFLAGNPSSVSIGILAAGALLAATLLWVRSKALRLPRIAVARTVEQAFPELNSRLLAALEQNPEIATGRLNVLQRQVMAEALHHSRINDWSEAIPTRRMRNAFLRQTAALVGFLACCGYVWPAAAQKSVTLASSPAAPQVPEGPSIEPGSIELERGSSLLVLARFTESPSHAHLIWVPDKGAETNQPMAKSLDDPVFAGRLTTVETDLTYRVEYDGQHSPDFKVTVYDLPALVRSDLELRFPSYTGLEARGMENAFVATVVEGSTIVIRCRLNKAGIQAALVEADGTRVPLVVDPTNPLLVSAEFKPARLHRMTLKLVDDAGRQNRDPEEFRFESRPNQPPDITLAFPSKDVKVSPIEELPIEATVWDDFGLITTGIVFTIPGRAPQTVELAKDQRGGEKHLVTTLQRLEELNVEPDDLVSYYLYADDFGPDGQSRRTTTDLYLAEVRAFEEIFRQMQAPPGGQSQSSGSQSGSQTDKLMELQKQIVVATWKQIRPPRGPFDPETQAAVKVLQESQKKAIEQFEALRDRVSAPQLQGVLKQIGDQMAAADLQFGASLSDSRREPLDLASGAAQGAYQGLLKLRAKEHMMMKSQQSGSGSGSSSSVSQEQLSQLELDNRKNRYEMQRAGRSEADPAQREQLAVLDRLKELARRQEGINEKIKELEASLRTAQSEAEREELQRQLKRLRDEQQQLLQDADETREKMSQTRNQEQMAESRNQLEQTRQRMVDTAEKLREGQLSQALNSGTRAERELKQLHEDFRNQTAGRFADAMRSLRESARQLDEQQQQLSQRLNAADDESRHSLRQSRNRQNLESEFQEQRRQAEEIVDTARRVVEDAEQAEPLLARQLYDTIRTARETKTDEALDATSQLLKAGFLPEARRAETQASQGIGQLRRGIESAAESVLGNEVESLKRAKAELAELTQDLERELAQQRSGQPSQGEQSEQGQEGQQGQGQQGQGQQGQGGKGQGGLRGQASAGSPQPGSQSGGTDQGGMGGSPGGQGGPLTGSSFTDFNERLRDVESMVSDPQLQADVARIRERARSLRAEFKRHSQTPNWNLVRTSVHEPMIELQKQLSQEIQRRESPDSLVPVDRDPVPPRFQNLVKEYYERLGGGKDQ